MLTDIQMIVNFNKGTTGKRIRFSHILDMVLFYEKVYFLCRNHNFSNIMNINLQYKLQIAKIIKSLKK